MKTIVTLLLLIVSLNINAQNNEKDTIINFDKLSEEKIYSIQNNGWALVTYRTNMSLINFSNKDYMLYFPIICKDKTRKPSFLIEFTNNYRDGHRGGLDFTSSKSDRFKKILFFIDTIEFQNPFKDYNKTDFENFINALKKGKTLSIQFYDKKYDSENELELNRSIDFKLENSRLLDVQVDCK